MLIAFVGTLCNRLKKSERILLRTVKIDFFIRWEKIGVCVCGCVCMCVYGCVCVCFRIRAKECISKMDQLQNLYRMIHEITMVRYRSGYYDRLLTWTSPIGQLVHLVGWEGIGWGRGIVRSYILLKYMIIWRKIQEIKNSF